MPLWLAYVVSGITISEKAISGKEISLNGIFDLFLKKKEVESSLEAVNFTAMDLNVTESGTNESHRAVFFKGRSFNQMGPNELKFWKQLAEILGNLK